MIDAGGRACAVTCTNGEGSAVVVPGTGLHLNNMMGEEDLNPHGFHLHPAGRRLPSMMAPTVVMRGGEVELVLGSAGSNRIRSAILQTIVAVVDHGAGAQAAVDAPRVHLEDGVLFAEPGIDLAPRRGPSHGLVQRPEPLLRWRAGGAPARRRAPRRRGPPPRGSGGGGVRGGSRSPAPRRSCWP